MASHEMKARIVTDTLTDKSKVYAVELTNGDSVVKLDCESYAAATLLELQITSYVVDFDVRPAN